MAFGKHVGSKLDRGGSTFASRHEAIKAASKLATRNMQTGEIVIKGEALETSRIRQHEKDRRKK